MDTVGARTVHGVAGIALSLLSSAARADSPYIEGSDYTVTQVSGRYAAAPANVTALSVNYNGGVEVDLPFQVDYFGWQFRKMWVSPNGMCQFGPTLPSQSYDNQGLTSGQGVVAVLWDDLNAKDTGRVVHWTDGTAPNRRFVVSWENVTWGDYDRRGNLNFQVHFFETTHRIVFAYKPDTTPSTWVSLSYTCGLDTWASTVAPPGQTGVRLDQRRVEPLGTGTAHSGHPGTDLQFDLDRTVTVSGSVLFDRVVSDAVGLGHSTVTDAPLPGVQVVATQPDDGLVMAVATTGSDGAFDLVFRGRPVPLPNISIVAQNEGCAVRSSSSASGPASRLVGYDVRYLGDAILGTRRVTAAGDASGGLRRALAIASAIRPAHEFVAGAVGSAVPRLDVVHDDASMLTTRYFARTATAGPYLVVGTASSGNEDGWDAGVVVREYARHVIASVAGPQVPSPNSTFDGVSDAQNAFAVGFGCALHAASHGTTTLVDGVSPTAATVVDVEDPRPATPRGPLVGAWVAAALWDTMDAANESHDRIDGRTTTDRALRVIDTLLVAPDVERFYEAWLAEGHPGIGLSRNFVAHGLIPDDDGEPNDDAAEAFDLGTVPVLTQGRHLVEANEDWYSVRLANPVPSLVVETWFNRVGQPAEITVEVRNVGGTLLATAAPAPDAGPWRATLGPLAAGLHTVRVRHDSGERIDPYALQAFEPLRLTARIPAEWTVGRPLDASMGAVGGVRPLVLSANPPGSQPPGLLFANDGDRVVGAPAEVGTFQLTVLLEDSGDPVHRATASQALVVNPPLAIPFDEFVAVPANRAWTVVPGPLGGTAPRSFSVEGGLPDGVVVDASTLRISGTASSPGSRDVVVRGADVAGSADERAITVVACEGLERGKGESALAAGPAACGFWVDAVAGSTVSASVGTAKREAKRPLAAAWIGPDGRIVRNAKLAGGKGRAKGTALPCRDSGRYFLVLAADDGVATRLTAALAVTPPKGGGATIDAFEESSPHTLAFGALAGAKLDLQVRPDARSGLEVSVSALVAPDGTTIPAAGLVTVKKGVARLVATLDRAGTWRVVLVAKPGTAGKLVWKAKLRQPRGAVYDAGEGP